jgi:Endoplasmic reticulum-based factor for assembly of V-ATPase
MTIHHLKRLEGVTATHSLLSLYDECLSLAKKEQTKPLLVTVSTDSSEAPRTPLAPCSGSPTSTMLLPRLSLDDARSALVEFDKAQWNAEPKKAKCLPIGVLRAVKLILQHSNDVAKVAKLEEALGRSQLQFTAPPADDTAESREKRGWQKRMDRLRLQNEETNYYKMTSNVSTKSKKDDDITTKSMTYAASVGLNMIVAPISFGVFMYFFSGPVLNFVWSNFVVQGGVDIRRVIIGVTSGVAMLFIEMLLFVIRTHEMDRQMRKKQKKKGTSVKPFGEYSSAMEKKFVKAD